MDNDRKCRRHFKLSFCCLFVFFIGLGVGSFFYNRSDELVFPENQDGVLTVNADEVIPKFSKDIKEYYALSLSTLSKNVMRFGGVSKKFEVKDINPAVPLEHDYHRSGG